MNDILLRTKLGMPHQRTVSVSRDRLVAHASRNLAHGDEFQRKLTLVSSPAGYGKTTMVSEWLNGMNIPIAWLSLDEADNDPNRFMAYLIAAIQTTRPGFGTSLQAMIRSPQSPPDEVVLTIFLNELAAQPSPTILTLDDYHAISNLAIHRKVSFLLEHMPACLHLVLITREDPLLPISRLRASNQVLEIRQDDLKFTLAEISDFMRRVMQLSLADGDITSLERRTEGWIAGLQLAAISMYELPDKSSFIQAFTGSNRFILDYLIEEVFIRQDAQTRNFLLNTAILDRLSGPLCDAVTTQTGGAELLEKLEQLNMFIVPLDQSRTWYRYHHLFTELLRHQQRLSRPGVDSESLHQRASQWFETEGYLPEAIQHALAAHDWVKAAQLIGKASDRMFKQGEIITLLGWLEVLPRQVTLSQPGLCMAYAWILLLTGKYDLAGPVLEQAESLGQPGSIYLGQVATAQAYLARSVGDNPRAIERSRLALKLLPGSDGANRSNLLMNLGMVYWHEGQLEEAEPALVEAKAMAVQAGNAYGQLTSELFLARVQASHGRIRQAISEYLSITQRGLQLPINALAYIDVGSLYYEWNELELAEEYMKQGLDLSVRTHTEEFQVAGLILKTNLLSARQDWEAAAQVAETAWSLAKGYSFLIRSRCAACLARAAIARGDLKTAETWLEQATPNVDGHPFYRFLGLTRQRLLIAQGDKEQAAAELQVRREVAERNAWGYGLVAVRVLQALTARSTHAAIDYLAGALQHAEPEGYIRSFADEGAALIPLLQQAARQGVTPEYAGRILAAMGSKDRRLVIKRPEMVEMLSEREIEVLRLVAAGFSNREIAGKLFISPGTAKTHIHHVCGKLGVRNRTEAATRAKELGLA